VPPKKTSGRAPLTSPTAFALTLIQDRDNVIPTPPDEPPRGLLSPDAQLGVLVGLTELLPPVALAELFLPQVEQGFSKNNSRDYKIGRNATRLVGGVVETIIGGGMVLGGIGELPTGALTAGVGTAAGGVTILGGLIVGANGVVNIVKGSTALILLSSGGAPPANKSPPGSSRSGAFNEAKRQNGVPVSQQPTKVGPNLDRQKNVQPGRAYHFDVPQEGGGTREVIIREDTAGHYFGPGDPQNRGPHFNDEAGNHYDY
jgi:hypothetical protein